MGSGYKTWLTGDVLTASDTMGYLMQQSVVTCTSGTRPSSPTTGQPIYETDTKLIRVWDGSAWYCPASPDYVAYTPTFYSNLTSGTAIGGGSVSVTMSRYQKVNTRVHYYGHAQINTTTASGFGLSLPVNTTQRLFSFECWLRGPSGYSTSFGGGHTPPIGAPYNRMGPVSNSNAQLNIVASGDTVHWDCVYESA